MAGRNRVVDMTTRINERDWDARGCKENAYVVTNGTCHGPGEQYWIWPPGLSSTCAAKFTTPTTFLALANTDNAVPPVNTPVGPLVPPYGDIALNRPIFIDEIGVRLIPRVGADQAVSNFSQWFLQANVMFVDRMLIPNDPNPWRGTCTGSFFVLNVSAQTFGIGIWDVQRMSWSPDRLFNGSAGDGIQTGYMPVGHGPNATATYAKLDNQVITDTAPRPVVPLITSTADPNSGIYRPPKNSLILDPGQIITIQYNDLYFPNVGGYFDVGGGDWINVPAVGTFDIAAWIRFRQPILNEPFDWNKPNQYVP